LTRIRQASAKQYAQRPDSRKHPGVFAQPGMLRPIHGRTHREGRIGGSQGDQPPSHAARRSMNGNAKGIHHSVFSGQFLVSCQSPVFGLAEN
jgi:hypothetical protein